MKIFHSILTIILSMAFMTSPAWTDTLILKTGDRVTGSFDGGTANVVKFRTVYRGVREYDIKSVQQIQFGDKQNKTVDPTTSAEPSGSSAAQIYPAGSKITIRMIDSINNEDQTEGSLFVASLEESIMSGGIEVIPKGADVWGRVTGSNPPGLELTQIFVNGIPYSVTTGELRMGEKLDIPSGTKLEFTLKMPLLIAAREEL